MTHAFSAHQIKNNLPPKKQKPKDGTTLRRLYDLLLTGELIQVTRLVTHIYWREAKRQLRDHYCLELIGYPGYGGGVKCIGIWDGPFLVPIERYEA